ncbi:cobaltochelatase CobT-related protein [Cupriavidus campinensis]|uniref:Cobalamin biosynthesis protein CobT n=1 Tax=Cupriavidus campinensis TaxID=151783 RepID=A0ABY3ET87_9BURK|nr:cobalamin biosynthesis protein CobT [Cupriavidus campinensis]TSP13991.1 cobalamin biosynthesis protein CobT [Cupriavidus campinensis]
MNQRVLILREAVGKITQMLVGKGIEVTQQGVEAYVKHGAGGRPVLVNLPYLPDNANDELVDAIQGFLDHQVALCLFGDFTLRDKAKRQGKTVDTVHRVLEEIRCEKKMAERFQGSKSNLRNTQEFFVNRFLQPKVEELAKKGDAKGVSGVLLGPLIRSLGGNDTFRDFMADKLGNVDPINKAIEELGPTIEAMDSADDAYSLAGEITKRLHLDPESEGPGGDDDKKGGGGKSRMPGGSKSPGGKSAGGKGKKEEGEGAESGTGGSGDGEGDEDDESEGEGGGGKGSDPSEDEGVGEGAGGKGEDDAEEDEDADDDGKDGKDKAPKEEENEAGDDAPAGAIDFDKANGFSEDLIQVMSDDAASASSKSKYRVFTKDFDVIEPLTVGKGYRDEMFRNLADKVEHMVGPLQKDLERAVAARSLSVKSAGHRSGRLNGSSLHRLALKDNRVFSRKEESSTKDVAVSLVVDASGSMYGGKINLAAQSAYALSQVLERMKISHEVICFTTGEHTRKYSSSDVAKRLEDSRKRLGKDFSRQEPLFMPILKGFEERLDVETKKRFGWLPNAGFLANNVDGECVEIAARRLIVRREAGKIMIVLSDGQPSAYGNHAELQAHLKQVVQDVVKAGVRVVGLGIMSTAVASYYPKHIVINDVDELPSRVVGELRHLLLNP